MLPSHGDVRDLGIACEWDISGEGWRFIITDILGVGIPEAIGPSVAPAAEAPRIEQRAVRLAPGGQLYDYATDVDVTGRTWRFIVADRVCVTVSELSGVVGSPTSNDASI
jgi:hypothetical protein